jgi:hypothetical protein
MFKQKEKIEVLVLNKVKAQMEYLCQVFPNLEWSGILFYKTEGCITEPENYYIELIDILPQNLGSSAYTEFSIGEDYIDFLEKNPELEDCMFGSIHSHNTMEVFFSGTDVEDLKTNANCYNSYLSFIVNNKMEMLANVSKNITVSSKIETLNNFGETVVKTKDKETQTAYYECEIQLEELVDDSFVELVNKIKRPKIKSTSSFGIGRKDYTWLVPIKQEDEITDEDFEQNAIGEFDIYFRESYLKSFDDDVCDILSSDFIEAYQEFFTEYYIEEDVPFITTLYYYVAYLKVHYYEGNDYGLEKAKKEVLVEYKKLNFNK